MINFLNFLNEVQIIILLTNNKILVGLTYASASHLVPCFLELHLFLPNTEKNINKRLIWARDYINYWHTGILESFGSLDENVDKNEFSCILVEHSCQRQYTA